MMYEQTVTATQVHNLEGEKFLRDLLDGKTIVAVEESKLTLSDGCVVEFYESDQDCCASASGEWFILKDNEPFGACIRQLSINSRDFGPANYDEGRYSEVEVILYGYGLPILMGVWSANRGNGDYYGSTLSLRVSKDTVGLYDAWFISS